MASCLIIVGSLTAAFGHAVDGAGAATTVTWVVEGHPAVRNAIIGEERIRSFFFLDRPMLTRCLSLSSFLLYAARYQPVYAPADHGGRADLFVCSFASTWGPCSWTYASELTPLRVRAKAVSFATATNWVCRKVVFTVCSR